jgi:hypothetical protein
MQFQSFAGLKKGAGNPAGSEAKQATTFLKCAFDEAFDIFRNSF